MARMAMRKGKHCATLLPAPPKAATAQYRIGLCNERRGSKTEIGTVTSHAKPPRRKVL